MHHSAILCTKIEQHMYAFMCASKYMPTLGASFLSLHILIDIRQENELFTIMTDGASQVVYVKS